jgi:hypothetical protein
MMIYLENDKLPRPRTKENAWTTPLRPQVRSAFRIAV